MGKKVDFLFLEDSIMSGQKLQFMLACVLISLLGVNGAFGVTNDNCNRAEAVGDVTNLRFDTSMARFDGPGHCMVSRNIWYCYTAACTGEVTVSLLGSSYDTMLAVYRGCGCYPAAGNLVECNDDAAGSHQSEVTFNATRGEQYLIEVGGYGFQAGQGILNISCEAEAPTTKDDCMHAIPVGDVTDLAFDTRNATFDGPGLCMTSPNIWYCYTASCTGDATVSLLGSSYDTMLAVYNGCDCYPASQDLMGCNDDAAGSYQSQLTFAVAEGAQYLIEVGGYGSGTGQGVLSISCEPEEPPPTTKDDCANATPVGDVQNLPFDTTNATFDGPGLCMTSPNVWYCYTASCTGEVTVSLLGSSYDTKLAAYNECDCDLKSNDVIACNDDAGGTYQSEITFSAAAGEQYLIEVGGYSNRTGQGVLSIYCEGTPGTSSNDDCENAHDIGDVKDLAFDTTEATFDGSGHCMTSPNLWYRYTAACTGQATISLCGSAYDTMLAVYKGENCYPSSGSLMGCNDDACSWQSELTVDVIAGGVYLIEVGGYSNRTGQGVLSVSCEAQVPSEPYDLGDAPDSSNNIGQTMTAYPSQGLLPVLVQAHFPTVYDDGSGTGPYGPLHVRAGEVAYLGSTVTWETEADSGRDQDGRFNIRPANNMADRDRGDDGVIFPVSLPHCGWATFDYRVNVIEPGTDLWVNVWCDWNRDGDWDDTIECSKASAPEWAVQNQFLFDLPAGLHRITSPAILSWHPQNGPEQIWMRITLSEQPWRGGSNPGERGNAGSGPQAKYDIGETEDYYFAPDMSHPICEDFNGDGVINTSDLITFTTMWIENCPE
jgi:hypothetical protein